MDDIQHVIPIKPFRCPVCGQLVTFTRDDRYFCPRHGELVFNPEKKVWDTPDFEDTETIT